MSKPVVADLLTVNGVTFCAMHGNERCYRCTYDFTDLNNFAILDELDPEISEQLSELLSDDRSVMFNIYHIDSRIQPAGEDSRGETSYKCSKHDTIDCSTCFDWVKLIKDAKRMEER